VHARFPILRSRREVPFFSVLLIGGAVILLSVAGCQSSGGSATQASTKPNFGPPIQDVRTEVNRIEAENEYNAARNSQPTHQHEVQAEAAKRAQEKQDREKAAKEPAKANPQPGK